MGAEPWSYWVPYRESIEDALEDLKQQEFAAGRYEKPLDFSGTHSTIEEAFESNDANGTRSILDMTGVADAPRNPDCPVGSGELQLDDFEGDPMFGLVAPLAPAQLIALYGSERPTRAAIEQNDGYYDLLDRGMGVYIIAYDGGEPSEILFAGFSYD